jgi:diketogulonate reductase-like aldo/keto reductase
MRVIAARRGATPAQIVFAFARAVGIWALTGTTQVVHMKADLAADWLRLAAEDVEAIETIATGGPVSG